MIQSIDYYAVAPPLILALTAGLVLLLDAFLPAGRMSGGRSAVVTLAGVAGALAVVVSQAMRAGGPLRTFCVPEGLLGHLRRPGGGTALLTAPPVAGGSPRRRARSWSTTSR